jgi:chromosome segregation ATPase
MLARVAEVEGKLRAAQKQATDADERAAELHAQLAKARTANKQELDRARAELEAVRADSSVTSATAEKALAAEREQVSALRAELDRARTQLAREREERESLRARVADFAAVCDERDQALRREEELEAALAESQRMQESNAGGAEVQRLRSALGDAKRMLAAACDLLEGATSEPPSSPAESAREEPSSDGEVTQPLAFRATEMPDADPDGDHAIESGGDDDETQFFVQILRKKR